MLIQSSGLPACQDAVGSKRVLVDLIAAPLPLDLIEEILSPDQLVKAELVGLRFDVLCLLRVIGERIAEREADGHRIVSVEWA